MDDILDELTKNRKEFEKKYGKWAQGIPVRPGTFWKSRYPANGEEGSSVWETFYFIHSSSKKTNICNGIALTRYGDTSKSDLIFTKWSIARRSDIVIGESDEEVSAEDFMKEWEKIQEDVPAVISDKENTNV